MMFPAPSHSCRAHCRNGRRTTSSAPPTVSIYQGTMRMGEHDDGTSVADPDSRVWGYDNLVVGGNALIPTATTMNPTLMSTAIAVKGARAAARRLLDRVG